MSETQGKTTPTTVEPGQTWRDNDQRTKGSGEFVVLEVFHDVRYAGYNKQRSGYFARVQRPDTGRKTVIAVTRLLNGTNTQRGYTYLGMSR